jgi:acetyl esterase
MTHAPHPEMAAILAENAATPVPDLTRLPLPEARALFRANNEAWNRDLPPLDTRDAEIGGIACRVLMPDAVGAGTILFVHGGGWTFGSPATHERFARLLALTARRRVVVPDYRLAPEHPAPAAIEDVLAVLAADADRAGPVALCGDSAGANIALAAALTRPAVPIAGLSLLYGCFAPDFDTASHRALGDGRFGLSTERMRWYWANWLGAARDPRAVPMHGALAGLPPVHLLAAGLDPLRDDSIALAARLADAGVPTRLDLVPGVVHGFLQMTTRLSPARSAATKAAAELRAALENHGGT